MGAAATTTKKTQKEGAKKEKKKKSLNHACVEVRGAIATKEVPGCIVFMATV